MMGYASVTGTRRNLAVLRDAGWRLLVSAKGRHVTHGFEYAIDNGAWTAFQAQEPFDAPAFERCIELLGDEAEFIVAPDIVCGGLASLRLTEAWLPKLDGIGRRRLIGVQDGFTADDVRPLLGPDVGIFVGGSSHGDNWKERTLPMWGALARERGCYLHVARVNSQRRIHLCAAAGADSFDGTSVSRYSVTMHGHSYEVEVEVRGPLDTSTGMVCDFGDIDYWLGWATAQLDHQTLNEIDGLANPTSENLAIWFWRKLKTEPRVPMLTAVTVRETPRGGCTFRGGAEASPDLGATIALLRQQATTREGWVSTFERVQDKAPELIADMERWRTEAASFRAALAALGAEVGMSSRRRPSDSARAHSSQARRCASRSSSVGPHIAIVDGVADVVPGERIDSGFITKDSGGRIVGHLTRAGFGLGTYSFVDDKAKSLVGRIDALIAAGVAR